MSREDYTLKKDFAFAQQAAMYQQFMTVNVPACTANSHVFSCDHALTCQCGKTSRVEGVKKCCPGCQKEL